GVIGLAIGTRPDCVNEPILDLIEEYAEDNMVWIEYGLQSIHDKTLDLINRGHDFKCFEQAVEATKGRGIKICAHVILGLPGETKSDMLETANAIAQMNIDGIKLHLLYVVKDTPLEALYRQGYFECLTQEQYVETACDFIERLPENMVIQRVTGEPHLRELVSPQWSLDKRGTMEMIKQILEKRDTWQGIKMGSSPLSETQPDFLWKNRKTEL
ncbi:TIGR01212 family radical SAM protein, partial [Desulfobacterales bacterium HSG16]|nr:TIGR01212 family radical SAM protein [Desulfobacterales bacterium HSG16]